MSTTKRPRQGQSEAESLLSAQPAKKQRLSNSSSRPATGLASLLSNHGKPDYPVRAQLSRNGVKDTARNMHDESHSVVASNLQAQDDVDKDAPAQSDAALTSSDDEDADDEPPLPPSQINGSQSNSSRTGTTLINGATHDDEQNLSTQPVSASNEAPTFGDMLSAKYPNHIDVEASLLNQPTHSTALVPADNSRNLQPPPATSLATVLSQALKTNDRELLESCLQMNDVASIRSTIQRLPSPLIASLMLRLAERMHKRPGRAGSLMHWIQWSLVAHGGYLAGQPELVRRLGALLMVVKERANSLQPLMMLKGKLDLLSAQVELRRNSRQARPRQTAGADEADLERDDIIYVEGQDDSTDDSDSDAADDANPRAITSKPRRRTNEVDVESESDDMIQTNGIHDDESSDEGSEDAEDNMIDDEAEETSASDEESIESDQEDDLDDEDDDDISVASLNGDVETAKPVAAKISKKNNTRNASAVKTGRRR